MLREQLEQLVAAAKRHAGAATPVTSGEDEGVELRDEVVTEEVGGPFVTTTRGQEVAEEPDESNPVGSTREPFPKT
jgi:hypothetical protein